MQKVLRADLPTVVRDVLDKLPKGKDRSALVTLSGDVGAGKTTFVQMLAKELAVSAIVQSPTYVLMKKYDISKNKILPDFHTLVHLDLYRLGKPDEFAALKPEQFLNDPHTLVCVEWPERVGNALPKSDVSVHFSSDGAGEVERYIGVA